MKKYEEALILQKQVLEIRKKYQGPQSKDIITSLDNIASNLYDSGEYEEAIQYYEEELSLMEILEPENKARQATTLNNIAWSNLFNVGKLDEALEMTKVTHWK
ncbi:hypothetical protein IMG5_104080 [Ichthyophthirius multifiliis]|uniref:Tetratricopeptide repeat protein n=1 Tax=Ichthyophthirius multifiliis TaxID=5932 RepID=G0QSW1_ICHMU|nr:hypothetical protein IMG5_104080 [Ichthyophthirius multifiliis]EGR31694.1 hypothetical protein IMG5_104080 [Ichthyophthirius multifiliis]|eukprot:XP_004035180.1 hypothetical protein IMG5_104080 [Ichthyophthirius multifiliis]